MASIFYCLALSNGAASSGHLGGLTVDATADFSLQAAL